MKIDLPLETWVDVFMYLSRLQLMQLVPHIKKGGKHPIRSTIGDRQFVSFIQFYLHKCGEVTLGRLQIYPRNAYDHTIIVTAYKKFSDKLPLADVPISQNIKDFEEIYLGYVDESVLNFLQKFQDNSLLTDVNIRFTKIRNQAAEADIMVRIMNNVMPLLTSINSIAIGTTASTHLLRLFQNNEYSVIAKMMFGSTRFLFIWSCDCLICDWYFDWLYTPREDGQPRCLKLHSHSRHTYLPFIERVKKEFEAKETASSFFIHLYSWNTIVQSVTLENGKTQEKLVITQETFGISISRYPIGANEKWIEEMNKDFLNASWKQENESQMQRKITIQLLDI